MVTKTLKRTAGREEDSTDSETSACVIRYVRLRDPLAEDWRNGYRPSLICEGWFASPADGGTHSRPAPSPSHLGRRTAGVAH
jgi:hypothetical protein